MRTHAIAFTLACGGAIAAGGHATAQSQNGGTATCSVAALQPLAPADTTITAATVVEATARAPRHCRADGHVAVPGNTVTFSLGLPAAWNGKFYFEGVGGLGGSVGSLNNGLARGYASASTDTGHTSDDQTWFANRAAEIDYGHRGTHVTAVAAKAITAAYYDRSPAHAYFNGCSNGGRQALMEVQRYPADFDGIIAGDPATGTPMQVGRALVYQHMLASEANYLSAAKVELLSKATLAACDTTDGLEDGLISDPRLCAFKPETLQCRDDSDGPDCLTAGQVETVRRIYAGLRTPDGRQYTPGFPVGHEGGSSGWTSWIVGRTAPATQPDGSLAYTSNAPSAFRFSEQNMRLLALDEDSAEYGWRAVRFPEDLPRLKTMSDILSPLDADLTPYKARGGKLILYHGWSDPAISAAGTLDYYNAMTEAVGGPREAESFARLYLVPGMHHCRGGPGPSAFDMLTELENWVEKGVAPAAVVASHSADGTVDRTRPLCPHPQVARYRGTGSIDDAANFRCEAAQ